MNITPNQFSNAIKFLADNPNSSILMDKNDVNILKNQEGTISKPAVLALTKIIEENNNLIKPQDHNHLNKLKGRLLKAAGGDNLLETKIHKTFSVLQTQSEKGENKKPEMESSLHIVCEVKPAPSDLATLLENIHLVINNANYVLSESLSVVDVKSGQLPMGWSKKKVFEQLKQERLKIPSEGKMAIEAIDAALQLYKPIHVACLSIIMQPGPQPDLTTLTVELERGIKQSLPTLTSCIQLKAMCEDKVFNQTLKDSNYSIYLQKEGGLALLLPPTVSLLDAGINPNDFTAWNKTFDQLHSIETRNVDAAKDLGSALLSNQEDKNVRYSIYWAGHGINKAPSSPNPAIGGLKSQEFQRAMDVLADKGMDFLWLLTCFGGGENMGQVSLTSGIIDCPVIVESSMDLPSGLVSKKVAQLLNYAANKLYSLEESPNVKPKQLSQTDMKEIGSIALTMKPNRYDSATLTQNLQTFAFQTQNKDIPHALYLGYTGEGIMNVDEQVQNLQKSGGKLIKEPMITDISKDRKFYFFSKPINPSTISNTEVNTPVGLLSRGGANFHQLKSLNLPHVEFKDIANETIAARVNEQVEENAPNKMFVIGTLNCLADGKPVELKNVVISATQNGRLVAYRSKDSPPYQYNMYDAKIKEQDIGLASKQYPEVKFNEAFYTKALECMPSDVQLRLTTGGLQSREDFFNSINELFWNESPSLSAKVCQATFQEKPKVSLEQALLEIQAENKTEQQSMLNAALVVAVSAQNMMAINNLLKAGADINAINIHGMSVLGMAVKGLSKNVIEHLLKSGANPNQANSEGLTPLHQAVMSGQQDIVRLLLDHGGDPTIKGGAQPKTAFEMAIYRTNIFATLIDQVPMEKWNQPFSGGELPIFYAMTINNAPLVSLLAKQPALLKDKTNQNFTPLEEAYLNNRSDEIIKIFTEAGCQLELSPAVQDHLEMLLEDEFTTFASIMKRTGLPLESFSKQIEMAIQRNGNRYESWWEGIQYFLEKGLKWPPTEKEVNIQGGETDLVQNAVNGKLEGLYLKILRGWKFDPESDKMQVVLLYAIKEGHKKLLTLLDHKGVNKKPNLWIQPSWQKENQVSLKELILGELHQERFNTLDAVLNYSGKSRNTAMQFLKSELQASPAELSDLFMKYADTKNVEMLFQMGFQWDAAFSKDIIVKAILSDGNSTIIAKLEKYGVVLDKAVLEDVLKTASLNPSKYASLIVDLLDKGITLNDNDAQELLLASIKLGLHEFVLQLNQRGILVNADNMELPKLFLEKLSEDKSNDLFSFLFAASRAGIDIRKFPEDSQAKIKDIVLEKKIHTRPDYKMFAKQLGVIA